MPTYQNTQWVLVREISFSKRQLEIALKIHFLFYLTHLLLSHFSHVWLCGTPEMTAHQAPPSLGFSRQEHWSGLPFPSPMHESEKWKWSRSVVSDSSDPMNCSLPGSSIHGIFQARVLEWGAIAFSLNGAWKLSHMYTVCFSPREV